MKYAKSVLRNSVLTLGLLFVTSLLQTTIICREIHYKQHEEQLFISLRNFLYGKRSAKPKKWQEWCNEWIELLKPDQEYAPLCKKLLQIRRWSNPTSIAIALQDALKPYKAKLPADIEERGLELGSQGMIELIAQSLQGK